MPTLNGLTVELHADKSRAMRLSPFSALGLQARIEAQGFGAVSIVPLGIVDGSARAVLKLGPCFISHVYSTASAPLSYAEARP